MSMQTKFDNRYGETANNRSFFISDGLIYLGSYSGKEITKAAETLTDEQVAGFHAVIRSLIAERNMRP